MQRYLSLQKALWGACFVSILIVVFWLRIQDVERIPDGQFTDNDAYLYYKQAQTIAEHGYLPARDMERWLPLGRDNGQLVTAQMQPTVTDVTAWELPEGAIARLSRGCLWHISFSPDGRSLAAATTIGCWLYDLHTLTPLALFETERRMLQRIAFSRDAQWIATGNVDSIVKVWSTQTLQCITKINYRGNMGGSSVRTLRFSEDAQYLAVSNHGRSAVYTWRTDANETLLRFPIDAEDTKGQNFPICFSPNSHLLAYVSSVSPHNTITISDIDTGEHITDFSCPAPVVDRGLVFSLCGLYLASAHKNGDVQMCNVHNATLEIVHTACSATYVKLAYMPDGTLRVAEVHEGKVVMWDAV